MGLAWEIYLYTLLPLPLVSVTLLATCGQWNFVRRACSLANKGSPVSLQTICTFISIAVFLACARSSLNSHVTYTNTVTPYMSPDQKIQILATKWRSERNFWISAFTLALWFVLRGFMKIQEKNADLRYQVKSYVSMSNDMKLLQEENAKLKEERPKPDDESKKDA
mmetsp:Transcript_78/g.104  ORF Transcript_78/g.104 Transcript_78/m.104 type:complete len:166 (-) Transcript_78:987-1484(-)